MIKTQNYLLHTLLIFFYVKYYFIYVGKYSSINFFLSFLKKGSGERALVIYKLQMRPIASLGCNFL